MTRDDRCRADCGTRRRFLREIGATTAGAATLALAGCQGLPFGPGTNAAYYHADGPALDVDYDAVMDAARDAGYTVEEPYYVGTRDPNSGFHPTGIPELNDRLGPEYRVFAETFFHTQLIFVELWFAAGDEPATVSIFDDSNTGGNFDITSLPPDDWLVPWLTLAFEMGDEQAHEYVAALKDTINEGTDIPSVAVTEAPAFARTYESLIDDATDRTGSETHGDGWYKVAFFREEQRFATVDFVVQSMKVIRRRDEHTYTVKLDRLGGFNLTIELDAEQFGEVFDDVEERRFGQTQTEYKDWAVERLQEHHTTTVTYTGDNNVTYNKICEPNRSDISVQSIEPVYLPEVRQTTELGEYSYPYEYYAAGPSRVTREDGIHRCVHCDTSGVDETYTYCPNCGAIACSSHTKTERLEGEPICTGCAVTERFALKTKYFYDEENLEAFRQEYAEMPLHEKAMENKWLAGGSVVATLLLVVGLLVIGGLI